MSCKVRFKAEVGVTNAPNHKVHMKAVVREGMTVEPTIRRRVITLESKVSVMCSIIDRWAHHMDVVEAEANRLRSERDE